MRWGALLAVLVVAQAGCGGGGSSRPRPGSTTTTVTTTTAPQTTTTNASTTTTSQASTTTTTAPPGGTRTLCGTVAINLASATRGIGIITFLLDFPEDLVEMPELPDPADDDPLLAGTLACRSQLPAPFCCQTPVPGGTVIAGLDTSEPGNVRLLGAVGAPHDGGDLVPFDGPREPLMTCGFACVPGAARPPAPEDFDLVLEPEATADIQGGLLEGVELGPVELE